MVVVLLLYVCYIILYPVRMVTDVNIVVPEGSSVKSISNILFDSQLIRSKYVFIVYVSALGEDRNLKAGQYTISSSSNMNDIVSVLSKGLSESDDIQITIPEGKNIWEIDKLLVTAGVILEGDFASKYYGSEGYLFPDTYKFKKGSSVDVIGDKMIGNFDLKTGAATDPYFKQMNESDSHNVIVMASILEKEAKTEKDMKLVAGIIQKRLSVGMPLEIDATVVYGACLRSYQLQVTNYNQKKNCDVTYQGPAAEIKIDSPYNTYIRKGLPPGPISNPGLTAIKAALNPQKSDYLYYLSTRDGSEIIYSKTSPEHIKNRRKYLGI